MKKFLLIFLILVTSGSIAQDYTLVHKLKIGDDFFTTDPLGNIYVYSSGDISKFNSDLLLTAKYSSREYGNIGYLDASNPLKILAVFPDFSKATFLDASLVANTSVDLFFPGIPFVKLICSSRDNGFWIFDPLENRLRKLNDQLMMLSEGTSLRQVSGEQIEPAFLVDGGDWVVMNAPGYGILVFDRYGTYYKTIRPATSNNPQVSGDEIIFREGDHMLITNIRTGISRKVLLPFNEEQVECRVEGNRIFIRNGELLNIYSY